MHPSAPSTLTARPVSVCACGTVILGVFFPASSMTVTGKSFIALQASFRLSSFFAGSGELRLEVLGELLVEVSSPPR